MVGDLIATPLGVAAMLNMMSIEGSSTDASPLILPQHPQGGSDLFMPRLVSEGNRVIRYRSFAHPLAMLPEPPRGFCQMNGFLK